MTLKLPSNSNRDIKTFDLWKAWSIWPQHDIEMGKENYEGYKGQFYHLHPEFVEKKTDPEGKVRYRAKICSSCASSLKRKGNENKPPPLSLKSGIDYGSPERVGLEPLSLIERRIISKVRHFVQVFKISSNTGR